MNDDVRRAVDIRDRRQPADAADKLYTHVTTGPTIKVDGKEEKHSAIKGADDAEVKNLVAYILSR